MVLYLSCWAMLVACFKLIQRQLTSTAEMRLENLNSRAKPMHSSTRFWNRPQPDDPTELGSLRHTSSQGLQEVFDKVVGMFKTHGQTKHIAWRVRYLPLTRCPMLDQTLDATKAGGIDK